MTHALLHLIILWIYMTTLTFTPNWTIAYLHNEVLIIRLFPLWIVDKWVWNIHRRSFFFVSDSHILISGNQLCNELLNTLCDGDTDKPNDIMIFFSPTLLFKMRNDFSISSTSLRSLTYMTIHDPSFTTGGGEEHWANGSLDLERRFRLGSEVTSLSRYSSSDKNDPLDNLNLHFRLTNSMRCEQPPAGIHSVASSAELETFINISIPAFLSVAGAASKRPEWPSSSPWSFSAVWVEKKTRKKRQENNLCRPLVQCQRPARSCVWFPARALLY